MKGILEGKVSIVTGAGSGIGRGIALRFAEEGSSIVVSDIDEKGAQETSRMVKDMGGQALVTITDVSESRQVEVMVDKTVKGFGEVNILVNNAGIDSGFVPFLELTEGDWDRVIKVNLKGAFLCCQAVARQMVKAGSDGKIIIIGSMAAEMPFKGHANYASSKGGLRVLTKVMAMELAPHQIYVNFIGPGIVETKITEATMKDPAALDSVLKLIPLNRVAQPREVANLALFLASKESSYVTGSLFYIDGGWMAGANTIPW